MNNIFEATKILIGSNRKDIDHNILELKAQMERENPPPPENVRAAVQYVVAAYGMLKPLLTVMSMMPFVPGLWRDGIKYLDQTLDGLRAAAEREAVPAPDGDATASFKAGRDLTPAA